MLKKWLFRFVIFFIAIVLAIGIVIYYQKDSIKEKAINGINEKLDAKVSVDGLIDITFFRTFPNITLELNQVFIEDKFIAKDTLANLEKVNFSINPFSLFGNDLSIESIIIQKGIVRLKTYKDGKSNYDIIKKSKVDSKTTNLNLEEIIIKNIDVVYDNLKDKILVKTYINDAVFAGKFYQKDFDILVSINTDSELLKINQTTFLTNNHLHADFDLFYSTENKCTSFKENEIVIDGNVFNVKGSVCNATNSIDIVAKAKGKKLENALNLIPKDLFQLNGIKGKGKYEIEVFLTEKLNKPKIVLNFNLNNAKATIKKFDLQFTNIYTTGSFSNKPKNNLVIKDFALTSGNTFLKGNLRIPNLKEKRMELKLEGDIEMKIFEKLALKKISFQEGKTVLDDVVFHFNQRAKDSLWIATKFQGNIHFEDIKGKFSQINQNFSLNGDLKFLNKTIKAKTLNFTIAKNDIRFFGTIKNALNYFQDNIFGTNDALEVSGNLESKVFDINDFLKESNEDVQTKKEIDLLKWLNIVSNIHLQIGTLMYKKLEVKNIQANIKSSKAGLFSLKKIKAESLNGKVNGNVDLRFFNNKVLEVFIDSKLKNIDIHKLFASFENFNQQTITEKNIKGNLDADLILRMSFDDFKKFNNDDLVLQTNFTLKNGELIKLNALNSLAKYLSLKQLEHIYFANYKSSISIVNKQINLKNSTIKSNLVSLDFGGIHHFNNTIDYKIKLNLKNLLATKFKKKKTLNSDYINDEKGGVNIYISMTGNVKNPIIKMDKQSANKQWKEEMKQEKQNLKELFNNKEVEFFDEKEELYFEEEEYIDFE